MRYYKCGREREVPSPPGSLKLLDVEMTVGDR